MYDGLNLYLFYWCIGNGMFLKKYIFFIIFINKIKFIFVNIIDSNFKEYFMNLIKNCYFLI